MERPKKEKKVKGGLISILGGERDPAGEYVYSCGFGFGLDETGSGGGLTFIDVLLLWCRANDWQRLRGGFLLCEFLQGYAMVGYSYGPTSGLYCSPSSKRWTARWFF
jgi:hypothetical protein